MKHLTDNPELCEKVEKDVHASLKFALGEYVVEQGHKGLCPHCLTAVIGKALIDEGLAMLAASLQSQGVDSDIVDMAMELSAHQVKTNFALAAGEIS